MPEWLSCGKSSFHLHIFLCNICLHDTTATFPSCTSYFVISSFWFSIPNKIFVLVRNSMLVSKNRKPSSFRIKNPNSCSLGRVAHAYLKSQKKKTSTRASEPFDFIMWMQYEFYSGTNLLKVIPVSYKQPPTHPPTKQTNKTCCCLLYSIFYSGDFLLIDKYKLLIFFKVPLKMSYALKKAVASVILQRGLVTKLYSLTRQ